MWDSRAKLYFKAKAHYDEGMKLLQEYLAATEKSSDYEEVSSSFLDDLDDQTGQQTYLLNRAIKLHASRQLDLGVSVYATPLSGLIARIETKLDAVHLQNASNAPSNSIPLTEAFNAFLASKRVGWKPNGGMEKSYKEVFFPFLLSILGDIPTGSVKKSHINDVVKILLVFPANKNKKTAYASYQTLDFLNIDTPSQDRLKPITLKKYLTQIGTFLRWLKSSDFTTIDLDAPLANVNIQTIRAADQRSVFTCKDLEKLFNSKDYTQGLHETASRFWVPLIALYTGARLNEICQLSTNDVRLEQESNRWIFDFNQNSDVPHKSLKRDHHERFMIVHQKLIDLGFLDYFNLIKKKNSRIFPELNYVGDENKYGDAIQRWFNRTYMNEKNCNITTPKTSFHSIRHTVGDYLVTVHNLDENQIAVGLGQSPTGNVLATRYVKRKEFSKYEKHFDLINFDNCYDSKKIRNWKNHTFAKNLK